MSIILWEHQQKTDKTVLVKRQNLVSVAKVIGQHSLTGLHDWLVPAMQLN